MTPPAIRPALAEIEILHVSAGFSAEPTLTAVMAAEPPFRGHLTPRVRELPLAEALVWPHCPRLVWVSDATPEVTAAVRSRYPQAGILATPPRDRIGGELVAAGADLVLDDGGVVLAAAGLLALARRALRGPRSATTETLRRPAPDAVAAVLGRRAAEAAGRDRAAAATPA